MGVHDHILGLPPPVHHRPYSPNFNLKKKLLVENNEAGDYKNVQMDATQGYKWDEVWMGLELSAQSCIQLNILASLNDDKHTRTWPSRSWFSMKS